MMHTGYASFIPCVNDTNIAAEPMYYVPHPYPTPAFTAIPQIQPTETIPMPENPNDQPSFYPGYSTIFYQQTPSPLYWYSPSYTTIPPGAIQQIPQVSPHITSGVYPPASSN